MLSLSIIADSDNLLLLVATESGVFRSRINGSSAAMIGGSLSIESNGTRVLAGVLFCHTLFKCHGAG